MIEARGLAKRIGETVALEGIDLVLERGRVALIGRNGSGKSTLLRIFAGLWRPSSGEVRIEGHDPREGREIVMRHLGYMPEWPQLHADLRPRALIELVAAAHGVGDHLVAEALERYEVKPILDRRAGELSHGERRAVTLVAATLHAPRILLLDEPINGLDPVRVRALRDYLLSPAGPELTLISTHQLDFVSRIAERYVVLCDGRLVANRSAEELEATGSIEDALLELAR